MTVNVTNIPEDSMIDAVEDQTNFDTEQANLDKKHQELLCKLGEINDNLKILVTYFSLITDQSIDKEDI